MPGKNNADLENNEDNIRYTDETTDKRIHEHLTNKDDIISEADIRNVKTDDSILVANDKEINLQDEGLQEVPVKENIKPLSKDTEPREETAWNIVKE